MGVNGGRWCPRTLTIDARTDQIAVVLVSGREKVLTLNKMHSKECDRRFASSLCDDDSHMMLSTLATFTCSRASVRVLHGACYCPGVVQLQAQRGLPQPFVWRQYFVLSSWPSHATPIQKEKVTESKLAWTCNTFSLRFVLSAFARPPTTFPTTSPAFLPLSSLGMYSSDQESLPWKHYHCHRPAT